MNEPCLVKCRLGHRVILKVKTFSVSEEGHLVSRSDKALTKRYPPDGSGTSFLIIISRTGGTGLVITAGHYISGNRPNKIGGRVAPPLINRQPFLFCH